MAAAATRAIRLHPGRLGALTRQVRDRVLVAQLLAVATVLFGLGFYIVGAAIKPGYSSLSQYISELNATGTAWASALGYLGFLPLGLLFAAFLVAASPLAAVQGASRLGWWLLWSQPVAFIGVALAPCDVGCPLGGSPTQLVHDLLGVTTYFAGALGMLLLSFAPALRGRAPSRHFLRVAALAFVLLFVAMLDPQIVEIRGALQRIADALLAAALLTIAFRLLPAARP
jgi:hypothetical protein